MCTEWIKKMFFKRQRRREKKRNVGSCFGSPKEEGEAETLIKDKRLFLCLSFLLCASATFTALLFFPSSLFFSHLLQWQAHSPTVQCLQHGRVLYSRLSGHTHTHTHTEMHTTHTLAFVTSAFLGTNKHAHA